MAIVVICSVCRTSMKVGEGFTEPKKIRCTGCRTLILLTPNPADPRTPAMSYPQKAEKQTGFKEVHKRIVLYAVFGAMCLFFGYALWMSSRTPPTRGAVEGKVTLDGVDMAKGKIRFDTMDNKISATADIIQGRYSIPEKTGPGLGANKVKITCIEKTGNKIPHPTKKDVQIDEEVDRVPASYNALENPKNQVTVKTGSNKFDFDPRTK